MHLPSKSAIIANTVTCVEKAFVLATPISGPACVYTPASVSRLMLEPTTLQIPITQAFAALAGFRSQGSGFSAWIRRIAYNMAMSKLRQKRPQLISLDEPEYATYADHAGVADEDGSSEESIGNLIAAIGHLRQEEQVLLQFCYYDGLSMQDIAYITSLTPQAVAMRLSRIRKKLKTQLSKHS